MSDWKEVYSEILSSYAIWRVFLPHLDPEDQDDEIAIIQHTLAVTRKSWEESCEGEDAREEKAHPTKAGDYKKSFMAFTAAQRWWESVSNERKAEAGRAVEKWNKLGAPKETHDLTMGSHVVMFVAHEAGEGQIKMAVKTTRFETAPADGKKAFTQSSESSKDWVLNGENILTDYLLTAPVEDDSAEKHEVEISLDEDGNPEMPTWVGQKLKVQQNLARAVFQAAYVWGIAKFMKKPKARFPWGLLIESPMEYLDSQSIPEGFMMKDPSKWTKDDLRLLWDHWQTLEEEEKVIVSFISCKKEDAPLSRQFDRRPVAGSSKKRQWVDPEDDSEEEVGEEGVHLGQMMKSGEVVNKGVEATMDVWDQAPEESSPAWYQVLVDLVEALPEQEHGKGREVALPHWATWTWSAKYLPQEIHLESACFWKALGELQSARFTSSSLGGQVVLGLGLLLRECSHAQEVEEDDPLVSHLQFLLNTELGIQKAENVMDIVGLIVARLEQSSGMKESQEGDEVAGMGGTDREDEEKEEEEVPPVVPTQKAEKGREWDCD
ncbi:hypothetical protein EDC04DRAFT_2604080 [Pisolithus marmoratus]|nr:hypothetical protein EDC04DRAFT_2604080 [Pisolithus marmoratus]